MHTHLIELFSDPAHLNSLATQYEALACYLCFRTGSVERCDIDEIEGEHSAWLGRIQAFSGHNRRTLILKLTPAETGLYERGFHQLTHGCENDPIAPVLASGTLDDGTCFLIMPDQTESHRQLFSPVQTFTGSRISHSLQTTILKTLASFHKAMEPYVDQAETLGRGRYRELPRPLLEYVTLCSERVGGFPERILPPDAHQRLRTLLPRAVHYWDTTLRPKLNGKQGLTICHGDCFLHHFWMPENSQQTLLLFDFDLATVHRPVWDLVTLLSTGNFPDIERSLKTYHLHAAMGVPFGELKEEFAWLSVCQLYQVLSDRERGCDELLWKDRLKNLLGFSELISPLA